MAKRRKECPFRAGIQSATKSVGDRGDAEVKMVNPGSLEQCEVCGVYYYPGERPDCMGSDEDD